MEKASNKLIKLLKNEKNVYIQTHDFPDPDAIAAAFGLQYFLKEKGIKATIVYEGELQTNPVESMVRNLGIVMKNIDNIDLEDSGKIIIVDGCKGNNNVANERAPVIGVIDHHLGESPDNVPFLDIRTDYGSSSTIIASYLKAHKIKITSQVATALAVGIHVDTNSFKRRSHQKDVEMFAFLLKGVDHNLLGSVLRNNVFQKELKIYEKALGSVIISKKLAFYYHDEECSQNLLGILADFFLSVEEVEFVALCAKSYGKIIISTRSENPKWNAARIIKMVLKDIGSGGGHKDMAGGVIRDLAMFDEKKIYKGFREQICK